MKLSFLTLQSAIKAAKNAEGKCKMTQTRFVGFLDAECLFSSLENIFSVFKLFIVSAIGVRLAQRRWSGRGKLYSLYTVRKHNCVSFVIPNLSEGWLRYRDFVTHPIDCLHLFTYNLFCQLQASVRFVEPCQAPLVFEAVCVPEGLLCRNW